jgi:hypothetical protein
MNCRRESRRISTEANAEAKAEVSERVDLDKSSITVVPFCGGDMSCGYEKRGTEAN